MIDPLLIASAGLGAITAIRGHSNADLVVADLPPLWRTKFEPAQYTMALDSIALSCEHIAEADRVSRLVILAL